MHVERSSFRDKSNDLAIQRIYRTCSYRKKRWTFETEEYVILDDFICGFYSECPLRRASKSDFTSYVKTEIYSAISNHRRANAFLDVWEHLEIRYPEGSYVKAVHLSSDVGRPLNGQIGVVSGRYENGRVGISFPEPFGVKALKPKNINHAGISILSNLFF